MSSEFLTFIEMFNCSCVVLVRLDGNVTFIISDCFVSDVEDLTHKTGNFKQFNIFVNMLESALSQVEYINQYSPMK